MDSFCQTWSPRVLSVLRIMTALMLCSRTAKFFGFPHVAAFETAIHVAARRGGVLEIGGGLSC